MKIALETLGCKLNQAETERLARQFTEAGHCLVSSAAEADICILNTCTVTQTADSKSRYWLRQAHRSNPRALVIATGCYAQHRPDEMAQVEGVSLIVSNAEKLHLLQILGEHGYLSDPVSTGGYSVAPRTRAFINVQDGCSHFCTYCIVPTVRGCEKSQSADSVLAEVKQRVAEGCQEIVITGTEVGSYQDNGLNLKGLLERILGEIDVPRTRLSSLQPQEIDSELLALWQNSRLCPHFHLSLQSGSDPVLRRMKRGYSAADYRQAVHRIRNAVPGVAITTDVIVGFPGETEDEFAESYKFCREMQFARIHVFPYSSRSGTAASRMLGQVSAGVKKERSQKMLAMARESENNFRNSLKGKTVTVLWEKKMDNGLWSGLTESYVRVYTRSSQNLSNWLLPFEMTK